MPETQTRTQYAYATRISENIALTPENYAICTNCILGRTGTQPYKRRSELGLESGPDTLVDVDRPHSEVTSKTFLASLLGKAVTLAHPAGMLNATTHAHEAKGVILAVRIAPELDQDGNTLIQGDLMLYAPDVIALVTSGALRQLSVGYTFSLYEGPNGELEMHDLLANHCALVSAGRAGNAEIKDGAPLPAAPVESYEAMMRRFHRCNPQEAAPAPVPERPIFAYDNSDISPLINEIQGGDQEENNVDNARMEKLCQLLEALIAKMGATKSAADLSEPGDGEKPSALGTELIPVNALAEPERGTNPVIDSLRRLKPYIQASGDAQAIDCFNSAIRAARRGNVGPAERLIAAHDRQNSQQGDYENSVLRARARMLGLPEPTRPCRTSLIAGDHRQSEPSFQSQIDQRRKELLAK